MDFGMFGSSQKMATKKKMKMSAPKFGAGFGGGSAMRSN